MQVILVLTDVGDDKIAYSLFEAKGDRETAYQMATSPSVQIGAILGAFLKTVETFTEDFSKIVISEEVKSKYPDSDWRAKFLKTDSTVVQLDLSKLKPKGNS
jgi:hypothetical protein